MEKNFFPIVARPKMRYYGLCVSYNLPRGDQAGFSSRFWSRMGRGRSVPNLVLYSKFALWLCLYPSLSLFSFMKSWFICFVCSKILRQFIFYPVPFLNLCSKYLLRLFIAILLSKFLILQISFRKFLKDKTRIFWYCIYVVWVKVVRNFQ